MMEADYGLMPYTMRWRRPGQYVFIRCRDISHYEWHPFSLTSAPADNFLQVRPLRLSICHATPGSIKL